MARSELALVGSQVSLEGWATAWGGAAMVREHGAQASYALVANFNAIFRQETLNDGHGVWGSAFVKRWCVLDAVEEELSGGEALGQGAV